MLTNCRSAHDGLLGCTPNEQLSEVRTMAPPAGLEPATHGVETHCSNPLSYGGIRVDDNARARALNLRGSHTVSVAQSRRSVPGYRGTDLRPKCATTVTQPTTQNREVHPVRAGG